MVEADGKAEVRVRKLLGFSALRVVQVDCEYSLVVMWPERII